MRGDAAEQRTVGAITLCRVLSAAGDTGRPVVKSARDGLALSPDERLGAERAAEGRQSPLLLGRHAPFDSNR